MLCLKSEVFDDFDSDRSNNNISNGGGGFVLPTNLGSCIHRYLWRTRRVSSRSISFDGSPSSSISDFEDSIPSDKRSGQVKGGNSSVHKYQLEQDVKNLEQQLQKEIDLRIALTSAVEHSDSALSNSSCQFPEKTQELFDSVANLEIIISRLEKESVSLQYQLSQERNERRLVEYYLSCSYCSESSLPDSSQAYSTKQVMSSCSKEKVDEKMEGKPPWPDRIEKPNLDRFTKRLYHYPNQLSEEMISCMRDIFIFLADSSKLNSSECMPSPSSPQANHSFSSLASFSDSSIVNSSVMSPSIDMEHYSEVSARDCKFDPYRIPGKLNWTESIGIYSKAVEVSWLSVGSKEIEYASKALKRFRLFVEQLAEVNPSCLSCSEKLAFWINIYNALIMHAFLAYGLPRSDVKLYALMQKAAYTIGGCSFSAAEIEYAILKIKAPAHHPQTALFRVFQNFNATEEQKMFSINQPEPLLAFALSCGMHSSPAIRVFRPETVNELLKTSLKDYIQASVGISNKSKLLVPRLLYSFVKGIVEDSMLPEWICQFLSPKQAAIIRDCSAKHKWIPLGARSFSVLPFDSRFRFLFLL